uniref:Uncharacterized protein n=1 Tax=Lepeophtheirus salmonis TaxID=72036 RepID=A0A0K2TH59_LEPSM
MYKYISDVLVDVSFMCLMYFNYFYLRMSRGVSRIILGGGGEGRKQDYIGGGGGSFAYEIEFLKKFKNQKLLTKNFKNLFFSYKFSIFRKKLNFYTNS